ncbi:sulfatase [Kiritimatiellaeota bacterium B1221]|nr:sulfatase [Kiritimatiellaeota bacterium B1221]
MKKYISALCILLCLLPLGAQTEKMNVLFIAVDDLKPLLGTYGDEQVISPRIDQLAARGTVFLNAQCQQPVCGPSRASLLTGMRPDSTQIYDLETRMRDKNPDLISLPEYFKQQGYETVGMGKIYDPRCVDGRKFQDKPSWSIPFKYFYGKSDNTAGFANPETVADIASKKDKNGKPIPVWNVSPIPATEGTEDLPDNGYIDGAIAEGAVSWIGKLAKQDKPFFLAVGFKRPHLPFNAPKKYWDLYDRASFELAPYQKAPEGTPDFTINPGWEIRGHYQVPRRGPFSDELQRELIHGYYACTSYVDAQVGKVVDALEAAGVADKTIIVLWGDHGWHLGDHGQWCKHSVYEQATRAPLIIYSPGQKGQHGRATTPAEFIDIFPTLCDLTGFQGPEQLEGVSLKPVLDDPGLQIRKVAMSQFPRETDGKMLMGYTFRSQQYRYTEWRERKDKKSKGDGPVYTRELYDYATDPLETRNLIEDPAYRTVVSEMQAAAAEELARYDIR